MLQFRIMQICMTLQSFQSPKIDCLFFLEGTDQKDNATVKKHENMHDTAILSIASDRRFFFWQGLLWVVLSQAYAYQ